MTPLETLITNAESDKDMAKALVEFPWETPDGWDVDEEDRIIGDYVPKMTNTSLEFQSLWLQGEVPDKVYEAVTRFFMSKSK